ncbi:MAG: hypothetical protein IKZ87_07465 [Actinomycetaceae bacterium]|nr:hypothetical protein [Actinomycetaceae bacterium]
MTTKKLAVTVAVVAIASVSLSACSGNGGAADVPLTYEETEQTVTVGRGNVTSTVSEKTTVEKAKPFVVVTRVVGTFRGWVKVGQKVKAGQTLGYAGGEVVLSPSDATVTAVYQGTNTLPAYYPVVSLQTDTFSLTVPANSFLASTQYNPAITGRFQITGGVGPTNCAAIVFSEGESGTPVEDPAPAAITNEEGESGGAAVAPASTSTPGALSGEAQCLIPVDSAVAPKQEAVVVLNGITRENVLVVPVSSVAGRVGKGLVTRIDDKGTREEVEVSLGISDGARIEIVDGLNEGDAILQRPPNLEPRGM